MDLALFRQRAFVAGQPTFTVRYAIADELVPVGVPGKQRLGFLPSIGQTKALRA